MKNTNDHHGAKGGLRRLRRPRLLTYAAVLAILAVIPVATAAASGKSSLAAPSGLQNFRLKLNDSRTTNGVTVPTFSRTPAFAWSRVRGATHYEYQLSTSKNFAAENSIIWSSHSLTTPAVAVPIALPWITGDHASLYWHVRALGMGGSVSLWSAPHGFSMRWTDSWNKDNAGDEVGAPQWLPSQPGYLRWTAVPGATGYDVWFKNVDGGDKIISTITTVADERDYYTLTDPPRFVEWRVRARRELYGTTSNALPRASYGPWSGTYSSPAGVLPQTTAEAAPLKTVSAQVVSTNGSVEAHALMPAFVFSQDGNDLHRVYIATDKDCVNIVYVGSIVGGNAYAPRTSGPLAFDSGTALLADGEAMTSNEVASAAKSGNTSTTTGPASTNTSTTTGPADAKPPVDLWDSNWDSGRYYWTVVPVNSDGQDMTLPQDECQKGNVGTFQKRSTTPQLGAGAPFATGLSPSGRLFSASGSGASFYGVPLVAWTPSTGATSYDVEWSRTANPWRKAGGLTTPATAALLQQKKTTTPKQSKTGVTTTTTFSGATTDPITGASTAIAGISTSAPTPAKPVTTLVPLKPGKWYYRVRGIDPWIKGDHKLAWSAPERIHIVKPTFTVRGG